MTVSPASLPEIRAELAALLAKASRGPWSVESRGWADGSQTIRCGRGDYDGFAHHSEADAALIVAARNALPGLLAALADAEAARVGALADAARLREALEARSADAHERNGHENGYGWEGCLREPCLSDRRLADAALSVRVSPAGVILTHDVCTACGDADHGNLDCDSCRTWQYQEGNLDDPREDGTAV